MLSVITLHTWAERGENFGDQIPLRVVQAALGHRIPVVRAEDPRPTGSSAGGRSRPVALVITGGPDPYETPRLLAAMRRHHVIGTFLVVRAKVNAHPELARQILAQGSRLVPYTFTGADPASLPPWRRTAELSLTRHAVEAATGREASHTGAASPAVGMAMVLRDDGHTQVGQFQEQLFTSLAVHSHRLTTTPAVPEARATLLDRTRGTAIREAQRAGAWVSRLPSWSVIAVIVLEVVQTLALVAGAVVYRRRVRSRQARRNTRAPIATPVTVVVPAYNEAAGIEATVRSLASSSYPQLDIVVVDDGSTDGTADIVERLGLPGVCVIRQHNTGKPGALNTGIAHASHPLVVMTDGDTVFEPETITRVVQPFADPTVGAVSGNAKVANRGGLTGCYQHMEYVAGFNLERWLFDVAECMPTVPGPIAAFRRGGARRRGRCAGRHPGRGHRPVHGGVPGGLASRLRTGRRGLDGGTVADGAAVAAAVPLGLRRRPGYVETPASVGRVRRERAVRATRPHVPAGIQGGVPAAVSRGRRRHAALPAALPPRPGDHFFAGVLRRTRGHHRVRPAM
jgi:peptidoglycan/xylan/chitin deacetylase (PgdA/CDA1 family)